MSKTRLLFFLPFIIALLLAAFFAVRLLSGIGSAPKDPLIGKTFPQFHLPSLINPTVMVDNSRLQHKKLLVNLFASWCEPCKIEHPLLMELAERHKIPIFGITWNDQKDAVRTMLTQEGNPYQEVALDDVGKIAIALGATGVPESYLIDEQGVIIFHLRGPLTSDVIKDSILPHFPQPKL